MDICITGIGEVGLLFAVLFAKVPGVTLVGVDKAPGQRGIIESGKRTRGRGYTIPEFSIGDQVKEADVHVIAVDTPLNQFSRTAELGNIIDAGTAIGSVLRKGDLVIVRSTVPMGTTRDTVAPILEKQSGLKVGEFRLAYAPERSRTGGSLAEARDLPHLIGGMDLESAQATAALFSKAGLRTVIMENCTSAELGKLASNTLRDSTQALANCIAHICEFENINARDLVNAINLNYPRDRMKQPTPGVGGSCLTKDPYFLVEALGEGPHKRLIEAARDVNDYAVELIINSFERYAEARSWIKAETNLLLVGVAFKGNPETWDTRNSVSVRFAKKLMESGWSVECYDPVIDVEAINATGLTPAENIGSKCWQATFIFSNHKDMSNFASKNILPCLKEAAYIYDPHHAFSDESLMGKHFYYREISHEYVT